MAMQSLDQVNPPYTSSVCEFPGGGSVSVLQMKDLADAYRMDLRGSLAVLAAVLASLAGITLCPDTHRNIIGPGRVFKCDLRWWVTGDRPSDD